MELDFATLVIGGCPLERHWSNVEKASDSKFRPYAVQWNFASAPDAKSHPFGDAMKDGGMRKIKVDSIHLNREGQYLQACTWLAALFDSDLSSLAYKPKFLSEERAALMRKCAAEAVSCKRR